jgi:hypothetical protein
VTLTRCKKRRGNTKGRPGQAVLAIVDVDEAIPEKALNGRSISNHVKSVNTKCLYTYPKLLTNRYLQVWGRHPFGFTSRCSRSHLSLSIGGGADSYVCLQLSLAQYVSSTALLGIFYARD